MKVEYPKPGKYVVAVSGGVDSMTLLDILAKKPELELTVAHFDHGIRPDSADDRKIVVATASTLGVPCVATSVDLGPKASEAKAREVRYEFLRQVMKDQKAKAIITAHHQDDVLETAILNMLRGTGRKGVSALQNQPDIIRPLLNVRKQELIEYAKAHSLEWHEDPTNRDENYLRNYIRHKLVSKLSDKERAEWLNIIGDLKELNHEIDFLITKDLHEHLDRAWFNGLPHELARETMAVWLRQAGIRDFDRKTIERLVVAAKTAASGTKFPVLKGSHMLVGKTDLALEGPER